MNEYTQMYVFPVLTLRDLKLQLQPSLAIRRNWQVNTVLRAFVDTCHWKFKFSVFEKQSILKWLCFTLFLNMIVGRFGKILIVIYIKEGTLGCFGRFSQKQLYYFKLI